MSELLLQVLAFLRKHLAASISVAVFVVASAAGYGLRYYASELAVEQQALQARADEMVAAISRQQRLTGLVTTTQAAVTYLDAQLVSEGELASNLDRFYQLENATGVRLAAITQMTANAPAAGTPQTYVALPFTLQATGNYGQLLRFLHELEYGPTPARIVECTVSRAGGAGSASPTPGGPAPAVGGDAAELLLANLTVELLGRP